MELCAHMFKQTISKIQKEFNMNKKILISAVAAATIASIFTGCGSDSSTSSVSGNAVKAELNGATVSFGGATATTSSTGAFTVTGATAGATAIEITGGSYSLNGVDKNNTATLKATKSQINAGAPASMLTTLISEFDGNTSAAFNALGLDYNATTSDISTIDVGDFESHAVAIAIMMENATNFGTAMSTLKASASAKKSLSDLNTTLSAIPSDTNMTNVFSSIASGNALGHALATANADGATVAYVASTYQTANVIDTNATDLNTSDDTVTFTLTDANSTLTTANGNTSLYVSIKGIDAANLNTSYVMGLTNLDITTSGTTITLANTDSDAILSTYANSNSSYSLSMDTNATALVSSGIFTGNDVNVTAFSDYAQQLFADSNGTTEGTYVMPTGDYSVKVYVDVAGQKMTKNGQLTDIISSSMTKTDDEGTTLFSGATAYKVLDTNLTK